MKEKITTRPWDAAEYLDSEEAIAAYLDEAIKEAGDDLGFIAQALGTVARARGMTEVARDSGLAREALYRALAPTGNPSFATVMKVAKALGVRVSFQPITARG